MLDPCHLGSFLIFLLVSIFITPCHFAVVRRRTGSPGELHGVTLLYPPPYSPGFHPIELAFSKLKARPGKATARTIPELWHTIADSLDRFSPDECRNYFAAWGYDPD